MTNLQARNIATLRDFWDGATFYVMPADHRHSPDIVIASVEKWNRSDCDYDSAVIRLHPDGRREAVTDPLSALHFLQDARQEGRRI